MQFTKYQYEIATAALIDGSTQLEPDGRNCTVCGDSGHQAWECSHNPLRAMHLVNKVVSTARDLHEQLHVLGGYYNNGPSPGIETVVPPPQDPEKIELSSEQLVGATFPVPLPQVRKWRGDGPARIQITEPRPVEMPEDVLGTLKALAHDANNTLVRGETAVAGSLRDIIRILGTLVASPTQLDVEAGGNKLKERALFVGDDQGGHIMFNGLCWRPVRS